MKVKFLDDTKQGITLYMSLHFYNPKKDEEGT